MKNFSVNVCLFAFVAAAFNLPVFAQPTDPEPARDQEGATAIEEVVVTGTRIRRRNMVSVSPVLELEAEAFDARGAVRPEELINKLPQVTPARSGHSVGATTAEVDLRGLGAERTLVLVNGRRLPYGSPLHVASDINQIPLMLLEDVEVLTGGASATYGSDALAGVVNFKLRDDFQGVRMQSTVSTYQHRNDNDSVRALAQEWEAANPGEYVLPSSNVFDGLSQKYSIALGVNLDEGRGNIAGYVTYQKTKETKANQRDYTICELGNAPDGTSYDCRPSPVDDPASFVNTGAPGLPPEFSVSDGEFEARQPLGNGPVTDRFNGTQYDPLLRPHEQYSFGALGHYEIDEHFIPYIETNFYSITTASDYAPGGIINNGILANKAGGINCDNPFLTPAQADFLCTSRGLSTDGNYDPVTGLYLGPEDIATGVAINYRTTEHGTRHWGVDQSTFRINAGIRGVLAGPFDYDVSLTYSSAELKSVFEGNSDVRDALALNAVIDRRVQDDGTTPVDPETYLQPACAVNVDDDLTNDVPSCAPINLFSDAGPGSGYSDAALAFTESEALRFGNTDMTNVVAALTGDLGEYGLRSPFAGEGIGIAVGAEYRDNSIVMNSSTNPVLVVQNEEWAGTGGGPPLQGQTTVRELFGEVYVPVVEGKSLAEQLSLDFGYRYSDYRGQFSTDTYKFGINWLVTDAVRLRGSYQRAVRAPNVIELFAGQTRGVVLRLAQNPDGSFDPCSGPDPFATLEQCARTGVAPEDYGTIADNSFVGQLQGGNPELGPEEGDTVVFGVVLQPAFAPGLSASIDYFNIEVDGLVGVIDPNITLRECLEDGNPIFCDLIQRGEGGTLFATSDSYISTLNVNTGSLKTSGVDISVNYPLNLESLFNRNLGQVHLSLVGTYLNEFETKPLPTSPAEEIYDCAGYHGFSCGHPKPEWRHHIVAAWDTPWMDGLQLGATWRYIGAADISRRSNHPALEGAAFPTQDLASRSYLDLTALWPATDRLAVRVGVNNALDREPALTTEFGGRGGRANTYGSFYDYMGRLLFVNASVDFR